MVDRFNLTFGPLLAVFISEKFFPITKNHPGLFSFSLYRGMSLIKSLTMGSKKYPVNLPDNLTPSTVRQNESGGKTKKSCRRRKRPI